MSSLAVADTGPLVAIVRAREKAHKKCVAALKTLRTPLLTCWPVLTEAAWLLRDEPGGYKALGGLVESGLVELAELDATQGRARRFRQSASPNHLALPTNPLRP